MQNTSNVKIHILDCKNSLKSSTQSFYDFFEVLKLISKKKEFSITNQLSKKKALNHCADYLVIPPSYNLKKATKTENEIIRKHLKTKGSKVIACCGGVYKLASTGALDNKKVTTHWLFKDKIRTSFPKLDMQAHYTMVESGNVITTGGVLNYLDIICHIIKKEINLNTAKKFNEIIQGPGIRDFQIPESNGQSTYEYQDLFHFFLKLSPERLNLSQCAKEYAMSPRSFQRHLKYEYDITFREALRNYRIFRVRKLLEKNTPIKDISYKLGFQDDVSFRRFFKKEMKMPISKYRALISLL